MKTDEEYAAELLDRIGAKNYVARHVIDGWMCDIARAFHAHHLDLVTQFIRDSEAPLVRIDHE